MATRDERTYLVTGATGGIGEQIVGGLAARGAEVLAVARTEESGDAAVGRVRDRVPGGRVELLVADLADLGQVRLLAERALARRERLDALVLNAGVARPRRELTADGFEVDFATNHLSAFLLTALLGDLLRRSAPARVVTVASSAHRHVRELDLDALPDGRDFHHMRTYAATKLLNVLFTTELSRRFAGSGVTANAADPGFARTALGRDAPRAFGLFLAATRPLRLSPARAAATPLHLATVPDTAGVSGGYYAKCRPAAPSPLAQDPGAAQRLWDLSTTLTTVDQEARR